MLYTERTSPDITICRPRAQVTSVLGEGTDTVLTAPVDGEDKALGLTLAAPLITVPITEDSKRVFSLMNEDYIELHFTLQRPIAFEVGDYVDDEIFGRFVITAKQMPSYDTNTGGYTYTLKFERPYRRWKNCTFMLTAKITTKDADGNTTYTRYRKESSWSLTDSLTAHAQEVVNNLEVIGEKCVLADFDDEPNPPTKADEVKNLSYDGTNILTALTSIADAYECEWWVTYDTADTATLHFGKCENTDEEQVFSLHTNVESMTIQDDNSTYCNRLYAYGATSNIPSSYRKSLTFKVEAKETKGLNSQNIFLPNRTLKQSMFGKGKESFVVLSKHSGSDPEAHSGYVYFYTRKKEDGVTLSGCTWCDDAINSRGGTFKFSGGFQYSGTLIVNRSATYAAETTDVEATVEVVITDKDNTTKLATLYTATETLTAEFGVGIGSKTVTHITDIDFEESEATLDSGTFYVSVWITYKGTDLTPSQYNTMTNSGEDTSPLISVIDSSNSHVAYVTPANGTPHLATFNTMTNMADTRMNDALCFWFNDASFKDELDVDSEFTISFYDGENDGLVISEIPLSWWASEYDNPSSIAQIGENRLMLPIETDGYLQTDTTLMRDQIVEMAVSFNNIFPRCVLKVTGITTQAKRSKEEYEDGSKTYWDWTQYKMTAKTIDGKLFNFRKSFIKDGETLQVKFLTEAEEQDACKELGIEYVAHNGYQLAGMTFDVNYKNLSQLYTIVRNEDYGAMFPNDTLKPSVGDPFILIGWDVRAMESLGLLTAAEERLETAAREYLDAINANQFTFTCNMMSEEPSGEVSYYPFHTSEDRPLYTADSLPFYVHDNGDMYELFGEGQRVCVRHNALVLDEDGKREKHSRIIGYEYKFDIPYDSPKYTIGDTDAYSRIKKMEKEITKLGGS